MVLLGAPPGALRRLAVALALSASLHAWLILEVEVSRPAGSVRGGSAGFEATLLPSADGGEPVRPVRPTSPQPQPRAPEPAGAAAPPPDPFPPSPEGRPDTRAPEPPLPEPAPSRARADEPDDASAAAGVEPAGAPAEAAGPVVQLPLADDPEFYPARLLDVLPRPLAEVALRYPDSAAAQDVSGRVVVLLLIDELGVVVEATVIEADPPGYFEEAAIESFRHVLFQPAQRNGRAVKSRLPVEVTFDARTNSAKP